MPLTAEAKSLLHAKNRSLLQNLEAYLGTFKPDEQVKFITEVEVELESLLCELKVEIEKERR